MATFTFKWNTGKIELAADAVLAMPAAQLSTFIKTATVNREEVKAEIAEYIQSEIDKLNPKRDYDKRTIEQYKKLLSVVAEKKQSKREKAVIRIAKNCSSAMAGRYYGIIHDAEKYCVLDGYRMVRYAAPIDGLEDAPCTFDTVKAIGNKSAYSAALVLPTVQEIKADMKIAKLAGTDINHIRVIKTGKRLDCCYDFGYGLPMVNAKYLIDMIEALPEAIAYYNPEHALFNPIYFDGGEDDGILLPVRKTEERLPAPTVEEKAVEAVEEKPIEKPVEEVKSADNEQAEKEAADMRVSAVAAVVNDDAAHVSEYVGHYIKAYKRGMITEDEAKDELLRYTVPLALPAHEEAAQDVEAVSSVAVINPAFLRACKGRYEIIYNPGYPDTASGRESLVFDFCEVLHKPRYKNSS